MSISLLERDNGQAVEASPYDRHELLSLLSLLPASYRRESDDLVATSQHVTAYVDKELDLQHLRTIQGWIWLVGRPMLGRELCYQLLLSREILITEQMDMFSSGSRAGSF